MTAQRSGIGLLRKTHNAGQQGTCARHIMPASRAGAVARRSPRAQHRTGKVAVRSTILGLAVLLCGPLPGWSTSVVLTVAPEAQVQGPQVTLGDVAEVQGEPPEMVARMRQAVLGQAPPPGVARRLARRSMVVQLKHQGFAIQYLQWQGATQVRVTRAAQRLEPTEMATAVQQALRQRLPQTAQYTIRDLRGLHAVWVPLGPVHYEVTIPGQRTALGPQAFKLAIAVHGQMAKQLSGTAYIAMSQDVVSLTRPLARNDVITADAVTQTQIEVTQPLPQLITHPEEVIGKRARRSLANHTPLSTADVVEAPAVQKGALVTIVLESPMLRVTAPGEALEAGRTGETIRVKNISSKREVRAQVIDKHTVRVPL